MREPSVEDIPAISGENLREARERMKRYIFYEPAYDVDDWFGTGSGKIKGRIYHCPNCGAYFEPSKTEEPCWQEHNSLHHGDEMVCECGYTAPLLAVGKMRSFNSINDMERFLVFREKDGWLWMLACAGYRVFDQEELDPEPRMEIRKAWAIRPGKRICFSAESYCDGTRWRKGFRRMRSVDGAAFPRSPYSPATQYYCIGLAEIAKSEMQYSAVEQFFPELETVKASAVEHYLLAYSRYPIIEMLVKCGLGDAVDKLIWNRDKGRWDWGAGTPWEFLHLMRADWRIMRASQLGTRAAEEKLLLMPEATMEQYARIKNAWGNRMRQAMELYAGKRYWRRLTEWYAESGADWILWQDTLRMEREIGNNPEFERVLMPANLRERHDELSEIIREREERAEEEYYEARREQLERKYCYSDGILEIRVPEGSADIAQEGRALSHCVKGYAQRHINGTTCILFLRWCEHPETRYVTIELNERKLDIIQIHGYANERYYSLKPAIIHADFIREWMEWVRRGSRRNKAGKPIIKKEKSA